MHFDGSRMLSPLWPTHSPSAVFFRSPQNGQRIRRGQGFESISAQPIAVIRPAAVQYANRITPRTHPAAKQYKNLLGGVALSHLLPVFQHHWKDIVLLAWLEQPEQSRTSDSGAATPGLANV